jgi:hypothetical protein
MSSRAASFSAYLHERRHKIRQMFSTPSTTTMQRCINLATADGRIINYKLDVAKSHVRAASDLIESNSANVPDGGFDVFYKEETRCVLTSALYFVDADDCLELRKLFVWPSAKWMLLAPSETQLDCSNWRKV